ncbi:DUF3105 domain-containing protein [Streptosporangium lutulentum]
MGLRRCRHRAARRTGRVLHRQRAVGQLIGCGEVLPIPRKRTHHRSGHLQGGPAGRGPHAPPPDWQNCGIYDQPVANEKAVHSLEHGTVWITYRPDLPQAQVEQLRELVRKQQDYVLLSPYQGIPSPIVISSWSKQLTGITDAGDPRLARFISKFKNGPDAPEVGAACTGGTGDPLS